MSIGQKKDFENLREEAKTEGNQKDGTFQLLSIKDLFSKKFPKNEWIINNLVPKEGITIVSAPPGNYKTWILLRMAIDIARGEKLFRKYQCEKSRILIIDKENHPREIRKRLVSLGASDDLNIRFMFDNNFLITKTDHKRQIIQLCEDNNIKVVIFDSLVRINNVDENSAQEMSQVFHEIKELCNKGLTIILTHHERKPGMNQTSSQNMLRGSTDIVASVNSVISIKKDIDGSILTLSQPKLREAREFEKFDLKIQASNDLLNFELMEIENKPTLKIDDVITQVLKHYPSGLNKKQLVDEIKKINPYGEKYIRNNIKYLVQKNKIKETKGIKNSQICSLVKEKNNKQETLI